MVSPTDIEDKKLDQQTDDSSTSEKQDLETSEESSASGESKSEISTLDVIKEAIKSDKEDKDDTEGSSEKEKSEDGKSKEEPDADSDEPTEDELKAWKPKTRKRFEQLQVKYRDVNERLGKAEVDAGYYKQFTEFLHTNNLSQNEANDLFNIGALMKSNPDEALRLITPHYNKLIEVTGNVLPGDLQKQVKDGFITEQYAYELSRQRANNRNSQAVQQQQQDTQRQQEESNQVKLRTDIQGALASLENKWQTSDPDYKLKSTRVQERVKLMWYEASRNGTMPKTVEQATQMAETAKREIEKELRQFMPRKAVTTVDGNGSGKVKAEPKTTLDVIRQTLGA